MVPDDPDDVQAVGIPSTPVFVDEGSFEVQLPGGSTHEVDVSGAVGAEPFLAEGVGSPPVPASPVGSKAPKKFAWRIKTLLGLAVVVLIWSNPFGRWRVIYCPVSEMVDRWPLSQRQIVGSDVADSDKREFIVEEGELYLAVQETRPSLFITTFVNMSRWDAAKIRSFRVRHPELEAMWPKPSREDGGVHWVSE